MSARTGIKGISEHKRERMGYIKAMPTLIVCYKACEYMSFRVRDG